MDIAIVAYVIAGFTICCAIVSVAFCIVFTKTFDQQLRMYDIQPVMYTDRDIIKLNQQLSELEKLVKTNYFEYRLHRHAVLKKGKV